jgi:hypothetical protein
MDALLASPIPHETRATCDDCAMCPPEGAPEGGTAFYFSPRTKCCTYQPTLPNYLVGRVLEDRDFAFSAGRATLEKRMRAGVGVTPLGVGATPAFHILYDNARRAFGGAESLLCPHYLDEGGGRCGIWRHRNSVCATWFCKFERGAVGMAFWDRMRNLFLSVERALAVWCTLEAGLEVDALGSVFPRDERSGGRASPTAAELDGVADPAAARSLWGSWIGREVEFYVRCGRCVEPLTWADVERIGGSEVTALARLTLEAFRAMRSKSLPERLTAGQFQVISTGREGVRVVSYTGSDPLDLDPAIMEVLPYFDGRSTARVLASIENELGIRVEKDLVRKLADFEILRPAGAPSSPHGSRLP